MTMPEVTGAATSRAARKIRCRVGRFSWASASWLFDVLDYHHGGIDQHADGDGQAAQAHQVRRQPEQAQDEGGQGPTAAASGRRPARRAGCRRKARSSSTTSTMAEQRLGHGAHGAVDQIAVVVEWLDADAGQGSAIRPAAPLTPSTTAWALAPRRPRPEPCTASPWPLWVTAP